MRGILGFVTLMMGLAWSTPGLADDQPVRKPQWKTGCGRGIRTLEQVVTPILEDMAKTRIQYDKSRARSLELADCSGNFLRVSSRVAEVCPKRAADLAILPGVPKWNGTLVDRSLLRDAEWHGEGNLVRTTKNTAEWYVRRRLFVPIYADRQGNERGVASRDLDRHRHWFRPGTVVWYGNTTISKKECRASEDCRAELISHIDHMGVIASVEYDEDGNPINYLLYHGRNEERDNGITEYHKWDNKGRPPFGNGNQYVIGVAPIVKARRRRSR